jgi:hypothetical protein
MDVDNELAGLRKLLRVLESPNVTLKRVDKDVKAQQIRLLRQEISYLESLLKRLADHWPMPKAPAG